MHMPGFRLDPLGLKLRLGYLGGGDGGRDGDVIRIRRKGRTRRNGAGDSKAVALVCDIAATVRAYGCRLLYALGVWGCRWRRPRKPQSEPQASENGIRSARWMYQISITGAHMSSQPVCTYMVSA